LDPDGPEAAAAGAGENGPAARLAGELLSLLEPEGLDLQEMDGSEPGGESDVEPAGKTAGAGAPSRRTQEESSP
ncbi:MAG: hypothetical protein ACOC7L_01715, partial [Acidobacteriota bacterium]